MMFPFGCWDIGIHLPLEVLDVALIERQVIGKLDQLIKPSNIPHLAKFRVECFPSCPVTSQ